MIERTAQEWEDVIRLAEAAQICACRSIELSYINTHLARFYYNAFRGFEIKIKRALDVSCPAVV